LLNGTAPSGVRPGRFALRLSQGMEPMNTKVGTWRRRAARVLWGLGTSLLLPVCAEAGSELLPAFRVNVPTEVAAPKEADAAKQPAPAAGQVLSLADCVQIGLERQPALAAYRASVAAAEAQAQALEDLKLAGVISHDIRIRRQQAALGVTIASAGLKQAEWETIYAVTRNYFTVLFAQQQQQVAQKAIDNLRATFDAAKSFMGGEDGGEKKDRRIVVRQPDLDRINTYLLLAQTRKMDADVGVDRALAALREAMGVDCDFPCFLPKATLPLPEIDIPCCQVVDWAVGRRGELVQAVNFGEVTSLEVEAQGKTCLPVAKTFASVADIHARPIPAGQHDNEYRPEAVGPEMPVNLVGKKRDRVQRASEFLARARAVVDKTRNLIILESKDAYLRWQQETRKIATAREARGKARGLFDASQQDFAAGVISAKDQVDNIVLVVQSEVTYNEAVYRQLVALADLQRVTAGGLLLGWDGCAKLGPQTAPAVR
jgi:hypothetical protein